LPYFQQGINPTHPALLAWELNTSNEIVFFSWLDDMKHIALNATK
jgi:hypothetical protein